MPKFDPTIDTCSTSFEETEALIKREMGELWSKQEDYKMSLDHFREQAERNILGWSMKEMEEAYAEYELQQNTQPYGNEEESEITGS